MIKLIDKHTIACLLLASTVVFLLVALNFFIYPATGFWHLIDVQKITQGKILYTDVKSISPPLYYLLLIGFYKIGIDSVVGFRFAFILLFGFGCYFCAKVLMRGVEFYRALYIFLIFILIYMLTPWEIFITYMFPASFLAVMSLINYCGGRRLIAFFLAFLAAMMKITVGGGVLIGYIILEMVRLFYFTGSSFGRFRRMADFFFAAIAALSFIYFSFFLFGINLSLFDFFASFSGGDSKGGLVHSLAAPVVAFFNHFNTLVEREGGASPIEILYPGRFILSVSGISIILFIFWLIGCIYLLKRFLDLGFSGLLEKDIVVIFPLLGSIYASAMSAYFKPDDIILFAALIFFIYRDVAGGGPTVVRLGLFYSCAVVCVIAIFCMGSYLILPGVLLYGGVAYFFNDFTGKKSRILALLVIILFVKFHHSTYAWWESNIRGRDIIGLRSPFFVTDFYQKYDSFLLNALRFSQVQGLKGSVYSFPTSTQPYHVFGSFPPTMYAVHHADVFPSKYVDQEFAILKEYAPEFIFISRWSQDKINELNLAFSSGGETSQVLMGRHLDSLIEKDYFICNQVVSDVRVDSYNFPVELYLRKDLYQISMDFCKINSLQK